jgi:hypothetical protein
MTPPIVAIDSVLTLLALWVFIYVFWSDYRLDAFRDHVFSIRQELFLYAAAGNISFDHPAYTMLRYRMNVILRYGHDFTLTRLLIWAAYAAVKPRSLALGDEISRWESAVEELPSKEARETLRAFSRTLSVAILQLMVYRSFILYICIRPFAPTTEIEGVVRSKPIVQCSVERIESETLEEARRDVSKDLVAV